MSQRSEEYPATLTCRICDTENTLDSKHCKECGHWLVGDWEKVHFEKVKVETRIIGWRWIALTAALGIIIGVLIGIAVGGF